MYQLSDYERANIFLSVGNQIFYSKNDDNTRLQYLYGFGPSLQFNLSDNLFFEFMVGYGGRYKIIDSENRNPWYFTYTGGVSILYRIAK